MSIKTPINTSATDKMVKIPTPKGFKLKNYSKCNYLSDPTLAETICKRLQYNYTNLKILDVYSNNLVFSTALYNHLQPSQHLLMESRKEFVKHIDTYLESINRLKHNLQHVNLNPFAWKSYLKITDEADGILQPGFQSRDHIHDGFLFTGSVADEGLLMQWLACLSHQNWIQKFGNVRMLLWVPESSAIKITAPPKTSARAKCSLVAETFSTFKIHAIEGSTRLKNFDQTLLSDNNPLELNPKSFVSKIPMTLMEFNPLDPSIMDIYEWDYVTKNMMILKLQKIKESIKNLGPGAEEYFIPLLTKLNKDIMNMKAKDLTSDEFLYITEVFHNWPFKPESLLEFLDEKDL